MGVAGGRGCGCSGSHTIVNLHEGSIRGEDCGSVCQVADREADSLLADNKEPGEAAKMGVSCRGQHKGHQMGRVGQSTPRPPRAARALPQQFSCYQVDSFPNAGGQAGAVQEDASDPLQSIHAREATNDQLVSVGLARDREGSDLHREVYATLLDMELPLAEESRHCILTPQVRLRAEDNTGGMPAAMDCLINEVPWQTGFQSGLHSGSTSCLHLGVRGGGCTGGESRAHPKARELLDGRGFHKGCQGHVWQPLLLRLPEGEPLRRCQLPGRVSHWVCLGALACHRRGG